MLEGIADLPLHTGRVPPWLANIMKKLAKAILDVMVDEFGVDNVLEKLSNPLWFQAFNNVIGMDWDSSGSTTVTTGILKEVTWNNDLGILVLGGKGRRARNTPKEAIQAARRLGLGVDYGARLAEISRLIAKIDTALFQDKYTLYHHTVIVSNTGKWIVIQQGMNLIRRTARRYHWKYDTSFFNNPHTGIACNVVEDKIINLVSPSSEKTRKTIVDLINDNITQVVRDYALIYNYVNKQKTLLLGVNILDRNVVESRIKLYTPLIHPNSLWRKAKLLKKIVPRNLKELLLIKGIGTETIRALVLISDLIYNSPPSTKDYVTHLFEPELYSYAIGGKDGVPYPVRRRHAEKVISILEDIITRSRVEQKYKYRALKSLSKLANKYLRVSY